MNKENVVVIFGGKSAEHDISIITGIQALSKLDRSKYNVFPIYISREGEMFFGKKLEKIETFSNFNPKKFKRASFVQGHKNIYISFGSVLKPAFEVSCAILCCHGLNGEDGTLQGLLELCFIPYTGGNVLSCATCMDKIIMKDILIANGISTPNYFGFRKTDYYLNETEILSEIETELNLYENFCFVKPANLGSSIGISKCKTREELEEAIEIAASYDERIIVERSIENAVEVNCAVLGNCDYQITSDLEYPTSWSSFLNFDEKYILRNKAGEEKPKAKTSKKLTKKIEEKVKEIAINAFKVFDCTGVVRIDFLVDLKTDTIFINELNSIPGSLSFYLFKNQGYTFTKLLNKLIELSKRRFSEKMLNKFSYSSSALLNFEKGNKINKYTNK